MLVVNGEALLLVYFLVFPLNASLSLLTKLSLLIPDRLFNFFFFLNVYFL